MNEFLNKALEKIDEGIKQKMDRYGEVMKADVGAALKEFCRQDAEFAQAVAQGGSFDDCMKAVAKGVKGSGISDSGSVSMPGSRPSSSCSRVWGLYLQRTGISSTRP